MAVLWNCRKRGEPETNLRLLDVCSKYVSVSMKVLDNAIYFPESCPQASRALLPPTPDVVCVLLCPEEVGIMLHSGSESEHRTSPQPTFLVSTVICSEEN